MLTRIIWVCCFPTYAATASTWWQSGSSVSKLSLAHRNTGRRMLAACACFSCRSGSTLQIECAYIRYLP